DPLDLRGLGDTASVAAPAAVAQRLRRLPRLRPVPAQQRHCGPRTRQGLRDREADAATAPRHEGDLAGEIDLHRPAAPNAECGMRNAECTWERREASELSLKS